MSDNITEQSDADNVWLPYISNIHHLGPVGQKFLSKIDPVQIADIGEEMFAEQLQQMTLSHTDKAADTGEIDDETMLTSKFNNVSLVDHRQD